MDIKVALIIFVVITLVLIITIFTLPNNPKLMFLMEVIIESFMTIFIYGIAYYTVLMKEHGYPDLNAVQAIIMVVLIFVFFLFVNGGILLFSMIEDEGKDPFITPTNNQTIMTQNETNPNKINSA